MRSLKKFLAVILVALSLLSVCAFSASAVQAPVFKIEVVSETDTNVTVRFSFVSGAISAFDATFTTSSAIKKCTSIDVTDEFIQFSKDYKKETGASILPDTTNPNTKKVAFISTVNVTRGTSIYDAVFTKKTAAKITEQDIGVVIDSCTFTTTNSMGMTVNEDITSFAKVNVAFGDFAFNTKDYSMNYKDRMTLDFASTYDTEELVWESSNTGVAQVDEVGVVYASGRGSAVITVKNAAGEELDTCTVNVNYSFGQWLIIIFLFGWIWY